MPGRTSKYSPQFNSQITFEAMDVLAESPVALNISEICNSRISLNGITSQKMSRILNHLCEMGLVQKTKSSSGRMMYKSTAVMQAQGYNV